MDIKTDSLLPAWTGTLKRSDNEPVDLTGSAVEFLMMDAAGTIKVQADAEIISATAGTVQYAWETGDTDTAGEFRAEIWVTFPDGRNEKFPNKGYFYVRIRERIPGVLA